MLTCIAAHHWNNWKKHKNAIVTVASSEQQDVIFYDRNKAAFCNYFDGQLNRNYTTITCIQAMRGQYVQVQFNITTYINLYEIEVHGL